MWKKLWEYILSLFNKPDPEPDPNKWVNEAEGYEIRRKTYDPPYNGRLFSAKIDRKFHDLLKMSGGNTKITVNDEYLEFYGVDKENGRYDLAFTDKKRKHTDLPKPCYLRIYRDDQLHTVVKMDDGWSYSSVFVQKEVEL